MRGPAKEPVYVVIPVHNRKRITLGALANLRAAGDLDRFHVLVVDDGSTDGTAVAVREEFPDVEVIEGDGELWWTGAIVKGMQRARAEGAEQIIWLNDDCRVERNTLAQLVEFVRRNDRAIIGCQGTEGSSRVAFGGKRRTWRGFRFITAPAGQVVRCDVVSGNVVCLPSAVVDELGYPDARATPHYGGDSLYLLRAVNRGFRLFVDARSLVSGVSSGESPLYPSNWLTTEGSPLRLIELTFTPQSGLSWRVWLNLYWEAYSVWGLVMFSKRCAEVAAVTALRLSPASWRRTISRRGIR